MITWNITRNGLLHFIFVTVYKSIVPCMLVAYATLSLDSIHVLFFKSALKQWLVLLEKKLWEEKNKVRESFILFNHFNAVHYVQM